MSFYSFSEVSANFENIFRNKIVKDYLDTGDLNRCARLSKPSLSPINTISPIAQASINNLKSEFNEIIYGQKTWEDLLNVSIDSKKIPSLPKGIYQFMHEPCDFHPKKTRLETGSLVLGLEDSSILKMGKWMKAKYPNMGKENGYQFLNSDIIKIYGDKCLDQSQWMWMTKDLVPKTRGELFDAQKVIIEGPKDKAGNSLYEVAGLLDNITNNVLHYVKDGVRLLYSDNDPVNCTYARCPEKIYKDTCYTAVGEFQKPVEDSGPGGLIVYRDRNLTSDQSVGAVAVRKFRPLAIGNLALG